MSPLVHGWDAPTETGGRDDLTYTVNVSPPAQLSATVLTSTSATVTAQYNVDYTLSVQTTNCAGESVPRMYRFRIGKLHGNEIRDWFISEYTGMYRFLCYSNRPFKWFHWTSNKQNCWI